MLGPAGLVHLHLSLVVHGLLLLLHLLNAHANVLAERYEAVVVFAALRVVAQQRPYALADLAASRDLELALGRVLDEALHLGAVRGGTVLLLALGRVVQQFEVQLDVALVPLSLLLWLGASETRKIMKKINLRNQ